MKTIQIELEYDETLGEMQLPLLFHEIGRMGFTIRSAQSGSSVVDPELPEEDLGEDLESSIQLESETAPVRKRRLPWPRPGLRRLFEACETVEDRLTPIHEDQSDAESQILDFGAVGSDIISGHLRRESTWGDRPTTAYRKAMDRLVGQGRVVKSGYGSYRRTDRTHVWFNADEIWGPFGNTHLANRKLPGVEDFLVSMRAPVDDVTLAGYFRTSLDGVAGMMEPYLRSGQVHAAGAEAGHVIYGTDRQILDNDIRLEPPLDENTALALNGFPFGTVSETAILSHLGNEGVENPATAIEELSRRGHILVHPILGRLAAAPIGFSRIGKHPHRVFELTTVGALSSHRRPGRRASPFSALIKDLGLPLILEDFSDLYWTVAHGWTSSMLNREFQIPDDMSRLCRGLNWLSLLEETVGLKWKLTRDGDYLARIAAHITNPGTGGVPMPVQKVSGDTGRASFGYSHRVSILDLPIEEAYFEK